MKYQIKKLATITTILFAATTSNAFADCEWTHGSMGQTLQSTSDRLKLYAACKSDCKRLENELNNTVALMNTASACGVDVLTPENSKMIDFFSGRFRLIRKQKSGHIWAATAPINSQPIQTVTPDTKMAIPQPAYKALWEEDIPASRPKASPVVTTAPQPIQIDPPHTKIAISPDAYQALWLEENTPTANKQVNPTTPFAQVRRLREMQLARQRQVEQQRQARLRKLALIQQQNLRNAEARKRKIQLVQNQERVLRQQLQQQRARAVYLAQQKVRQQQK